MYVVAACGVFVVGVKFEADYSTLEDIRREFVKRYKNIFCLRDDDDVKDIQVESTCDNASIVTALAFMDKFTDECYMAIRRQMTNALKDSIMNVYTQVYEKEMKRKIETLRCQLD